MFRILHAGDDLQSQREKIVSDLNKKVQLLNLDVTIVFDAQYSYGEGSRSVFQNLEICFTDAGETADEYILKCLKTSLNPRQETVVTSDNKLAWRARRMLAKSESVKEFLTWLNRRYKSRLSSKKEEKEGTIATQLSQFKIAPTEQAAKETPPRPGRNASENFEYYLYEFEKRFQELADQEIKKEDEGEKRKLRKKQKKPSSKPKPSSESDIERWLRIFEEKDKQGP